MIGKTLGHYQITDQLGKGGMGEVFRAKDQKLGRDVAIKVLPDEFVRDADRVAHFQREAKLLASLNHPNRVTSLASPTNCRRSSSSAVFMTALLQSRPMADRLSTVQTQGFACVPWTIWMRSSYHPAQLGNC